MNARRFTYLTLLALTIGSGLLSRSSLFAEDSPVQQYAGDALWAMAVFWFLAILCPKALTRHYAIGALVISLAVETSQLYQADWINHLRSFRLGALILGNTFVWADLACYTTGVWFAANIDHFLIRKAWQSPWNWWLSSTIKDKLIVIGTLCLLGNAILFLLGMVHLYLLGTSVGCLLMGLLIHSEDSTNI